MWAFQYLGFNWHRSHGEIHAMGPGIMLGYWRMMKQSTALAIYYNESGNLSKTSDLGEFNAYGLHLLGRMDQLVKHPNGEKVPVTQLEQQLTQGLRHLRAIEHLQIVIDEQVQGLLLLVLADDQHSN